jgi:hypothetical protein
MNTTQSIAAYEICTRTRNVAQARKFHAQGILTAVQVAAVERLVAQENAWKPRDTNKSGMR